jgi:hypothetical protein
MPPASGSEPRDASESFWHQLLSVQPLDREHSFWHIEGGNFLREGWE